MKGRPVRWGAGGAHAGGARLNRAARGSFGRRLSRRHGSFAPNTWRLAATGSRDTRHVPGSAPPLAARPAVNQTSAPFPGPWCAPAAIGRRWPLWLASLPVSLAPASVVPRARSAAPCQWGLVSMRRRDWPGGSAARTWPWAMLLGSSIGARPPRQGQCGRCQGA